MKQTTISTKEILTEINQIDLDLVWKAIDESGWATEVWELGANEALIILEGIVKLALDAIDKNIYDEISYAQREEMYNMLRDIRSYLINISSKSNNDVGEFIRRVAMLNDKVRILNLDFENTRLSGFAQKKRDLTNLITKYRELIKDIENAYYLRVNAEEIASDIGKIRDNADEKFSEIEGTYVNISEIEKDLEVKSGTLNSSFSQAGENLTAINNVRGNVETFNGEIEAKKSEITYIVERSELVVSKNEELENQIREQLQKSTGGNLFGTFNMRAEKLQKRMWVSLVCLVGCILLIVGLGVWIAVDFNGEIDKVFIFKLFLSPPLIYGLLFFSRQYGNDRKLQEEYSFKSTVSFSLIPFKEQLIQLSEAKDAEKSINMFSSAIEKIFTSPLENISKNPTEDKDDIVNSGDLLELIKQWIKRK